MTGSDIVTKVRLAIDEVLQNKAALVTTADDNEKAILDSIILSCINNALIWVAIYAPYNMITGLSSWISDDWQSVVTDDATPNRRTTITLTEKFVRLVRVRLPSWHCAVMTPVEEDSDEYIEQYDETAMATAELPVAAVIHTAPKKIECYPGLSEEEVEAGAVPDITYLITPEYDEDDEDANIEIPALLQPALIYYTAYLTLSALRDSQNTEMLRIALQMLGLSKTTTTTSSDE